MRTYFQLLIGICLLSIASCGSGVRTDESPVKPTNVFSQPDLGWSMAIPFGCKVLSQERVEDIQQRGQREMGLEGDLATPDVRHLLSYEFDRNNSFASDMQAYEADMETWQAYQRASNDMIVNTLALRDIEVDTSSSYVTISGINFQVFHTTVLNVANQPIYYMDSYATLHNGFDFSAHVNCDNDRVGEVITSAWFSSEFEGAR